MGNGGFYGLTVLVARFCACSTNAALNLLELTSVRLAPLQL